MRVKSIKIENYRSFEENNNTIELEDISTIIGKNESGKSNLIDCLGKLNLTGINDSKYFNNSNKNTNKRPIISVVLTPYEYEKTEYGVEEETLLTVSDRFNISVSGGIVKLITDNADFQNNRNKLNELKKNNNTNFFGNANDQQNFQNLIKMINNAENKVFINYTYVKQLIDRIKNVDTDFSSYLEKCVEYLIKVNKLFPSFIVLDDISLKSQYSVKEIKDTNLQKPMLNHLLNCINKNTNDILKYWDLTSEADRVNFKEEINDNIKEIVSGFNNFYKQEEIHFKFSFENDSLNLIVRTTKKFIDFDERSNGLKWYFNMYIQLLSKTKAKEMENYIILLDEPGVYLHINAQKEILNLFEDFACKNNQVIYTTQLPSMIYSDKLYHTRLIIKDDNGNSDIGNKYYSLPHKMKSKQETITPILLAIGMNMNSNFSQIDNNGLNIITEGISDYYYIRAYFLQNKLKTPNIIPCTGVNNIHNIASILLGWGCCFKIILDNDKQGKKEYDVLMNKLLIDEHNIIFVNSSDTKNETIENLFSPHDSNIIGITNEDYSRQKAYYSLETFKKVENGEYNFDDDTIKNFDDLFKRVLK